MQEYEMKVLYEHSDKFIVSCNEKLGHLTKNEFTDGIKEKDLIKVQAKTHNISVKGRDTIVYSPNGEHQKISNETSNSLKQRDNKTPKTKFINFSEKYKDFSKFLIAESDASKYPEDSFVEKNNEVIKIINIGKGFRFKNKEGKKIKSSFKDGDRVCYVYYTKSMPNWNAEQFMEAMNNYALLVDQVIQNGVKPIHKPELINRLKALPTVCDGRNKFLGHSWFLMDEDVVWYITYLTSSVEIENNIKIAGRRAQCWRVSKRLIEDSLKTINEIDAVLFKTNAFPNIKQKDSIILTD